SIMRSHRCAWSRSWDTIRNVAPLSWFTLRMSSQTPSADVVSGSPAGSSPPRSVMSGRLGGHGAETPDGEAEEKSANQRHRQELWPNDADAGAAIKDRLR